MKKLITIALLFITFVSFGQENEKKEKSHELKLNVFNTLIFKSIDASYEYILNDESAVGISFLINLNDENSDGPYYYEEFAVTPYYRHYFSRKYAMGFFMEAFGMYNVQEDDYYINYDDFAYESERTTNFALGFAIGGKFVSNKGFIFEFFGGIGRNLFTSNSNYNTEFVPRVGISLGYRF